MQTTNRASEKPKEIEAYYLGFYDDMGVYPLERYESNREQAKKDGLRPCAHCGKGMKGDDNWVIMSTGFQTWVRVDHWDDEEYAWIRDSLCVVGPSCAKKLCGIEYRVRESKVTS